MRGRSGERSSSLIFTWADYFSGKFVCCVWFCWITVIFLCLREVQQVAFCDLVLAVSYVKGLYLSNGRSHWICISKTTAAVDIFWLHSVLWFNFFFAESRAILPFLYPQIYKTLLKRLCFIIILLEIRMSSSFQNLFFSSLLPAQKCFFFSECWNETVTFH